ncbi:hypothetical protein [Ferrimonas gelatinilytica]|uniref:Uncharacterized protein n=1 Tax=Ferrimonas gelatinilytica TaxID=1255257 RepID=A0ABP9S0J3_9GAMM
MAALSLISKFVAPAPKVSLPPTPFAYDQTDPVSGAQSIISAASTGDLPADIARTLVEALAGVERILESVELEARLTQLEADL